MTRYLNVTPRLPVADFARTIEFYRDVLGFRLGSLWPDDAPAFAILERDEIRLQFVIAAGPLPATESKATISIDVDDALAVHASVAGRVPVAWGPEVYWYGRREFAILDADGYMLIFSEQTNDPPTCVET